MREGGSVAGAVLLIFHFVWTLTKADADVSCIFMERCVLPCRFQPGKGTVIHWIQVSAGDVPFPVPVPVHAFYNDRDQHSHQDPRFRDRTSLFNVSRGNASLQLTALQILDQGRYKCYTSTTTGDSMELFVNLRVDAPVRKVDVVRVGNNVTCSSEGIYPEPALTWSNVTWQNPPRVQWDDRLLYNISSTVTLTDNLDYYSCTVTTRGSSWKTTWFKTTCMNVSESETTVACAAVNTRPVTDLTWTFNHSQVILTRHGGNHQYAASQEWDQRVEGLSKSGSLTLQHLSAEQTGTYTCELSNAEETYISSTFLRIKIDTSGTIALTVVLVIFLLGAAALAALAGFCHFKRKKKEGKITGDEVL